LNCWHWGGLGVTDAAVTTQPPVTPAFCQSLPLAMQNSGARPAR